MSAERWTIRFASMDDAKRIAAIAHLAYAKYVPRIGREPAPMTADFPAGIAGGHTVVVELHGAIEGYLVAWAERDALFIDNIAVDPAHQGKGLGRALIDYAVAEASRRQLRALTLYTNVAMTENIAMYAKLGFVETHRVTENGFDRIYMRRELEYDH